MAEINIRIWDEDGKVRMSAESDPTFKVRDFEENTDAQIIALNFLGEVVEGAEKIHSIKTDGEELN